jgi:IS30 family transposase
MLEQNISQTEIAKVIGKDKSVISRELKRNSDFRSGKYNYDLAHRKYTIRMKEKPKKISFTKEIQQDITSRLEKYFSPEQIVGRSIIDGYKMVSHERIYQFIWKDKKNGGGWYKYLRRIGRRYRKRGNAKDNRGIIKNRVDIDQRPEIVNQKNRFGDFEIDTIIGKDHKGAILTMNERTSSLSLLKKLSGKNAIELAESAIELLYNWKPLIHTITADNGKEFAEHQKISKQLGIDFYFAKPYHSWERGANENMNGLIRQFFPKKTSFENIKHADIQIVQDILNNRPRKKLNFLTPNEYISIILSNQKVALVT